MALIDCIVGMSAERYFAIKDFNTKHSKMPFIIFSILSGSSLAYLIIGTIAVHFQAVREILIMPEKEAAGFLADHLKGSGLAIDPASVLVFRPDIPAKQFAMGFTAFVSFVFCRYVFAVIFLILNATKSKMSEVKMSERLRRNNKMLLRCTYAQFVGFCSLAGFPAFIIVATFYFASEPSPIIALCFLLMNCFGLYDIFVTVICIKPYRSFFENLYKYAKGRYLKFCIKVNPESRYGRRPSIFMMSFAKVFDNTTMTTESPQS
uniref:G protein-coupled receptor n=1 Tax=Panagrolaimus davidi TaxID=227884 RepID=A0A914P8V6_9BILA